MNKISIDDLVADGTQNPQDLVGTYVLATLDDGIAVGAVREHGGTFWIDGPAMQSSSEGNYVWRENTYIQMPMDWRIVPLGNGSVISVQPLLSEAARYFPSKGLLY